MVINAWALQVTKSKPPHVSQSLPSLSLVIKIFTKSLNVSRKQRMYTPLSPLTMSLQSKILWMYWTSWTISGLRLIAASSSMVNHYRYGGWMDDCHSMHVRLRQVQLVMPGSFPRWICWCCNPTTCRGLLSMLPNSKGNRIQSLIASIPYIDHHDNRPRSLVSFDIIRKNVSFVSAMVEMTWVWFKQPMLVSWAHWLLLLGRILSYCKF